ncbi:MAG: ABC transporter ATP-binding protein [Pseudomonadota bacterium]
MTLHAEHISLTLGGATILRDVSIACAPGQITALVGPNGAGKTSLLTCLAGLRRSDSGMALLDDTPILSLPDRTRARRIGYLPQGQSVHWDITARALVALGRFPHRGRFAAEDDGDRAAIEAAMTAMQVTDFAERAVATLSGGERARVLLARVLAGQPQWLLADEPLANLDIGHQQQVLRALRSIADSGTGVVIVLHDLNHALAVADAAILLDAGQVAATGPCAEVLNAEHVGKVYGLPIRSIDSGQGRLLLPDAL